MAVPSEPLGPAVAQTDDHLTVSWGDNPANVTETENADGTVDETSVTETFRVEQSADGVSSWTTTGTTAWPNTTLADTTFTSGTRYYRVYAVNDEGDSDAASDVVSGTAIVAPTAPSDTDAAAHPLGVLLTWTLNSTNEDAIVVVRSSSDIVTLAPGSTTYLDTSATLGVTYIWEIRAENAAGTNTSTGLEVAAGSGAVVAQPTGLAVDGNSGDAVLTWTDASGGTGTGYEVQRSDDDGSTWTTLTAVLAADAVTYTDTTGSDGEHYSYRVRVLDTTNIYSLWSDPVRLVYLNSIEATVPGAPYNLSLTVVSSSAITANWLDCSGDETGFRIYRSTDDFQSEVIAGQVGQDVLTFADTELTASTTYWYEIAAYNQDGESERSNRAFATTDAGVGAPSAPSGLQLAGRGFDFLDFAWTDNANNETFFELELTYVPSNGQTSISIGRINEADLELFRITPLLSGSHFEVRVRAGNTGGVSAWSNRASGTTLGVGGPPSIPTNERVTTVSFSELALTWDNVNQDATSYRIERGTSALTFEVIAQNHPATAVIRQSFNDRGLAPDTVYYYRVTSVNQYGTARGATVSGRTDRNSPQAPAAPTLDGVSQGRGFFARAFYTSNESAVDGFYLKRKTGAGAYSTLVTLPPIGAGETGTHDDATIEEGNTYTYKMTAFRGGVESDDSDEIEFAAAAPVGAPTAPSNCIAQALSASLAYIQWSDNSTDETSFEIERSLTSGSGFAEIGASPVAAGVTEVFDTGLTASTTYYYRVRATNGAGSSAYTNEASITTSGDASPAPTGPTITTASVLSASAVRVDWNAGNGDIYNYLVKKSTDGSAYSTHATVSIAERSYPVVGLSAATRYWFRVDAVGPGGTGVGSQTPDVTTRPNSGGTGRQPSKRGEYVRYQREFDVNDDDVTVFTAADGIYHVIGTYIQTDDATNGPFAVLSIGATTIAQFPAGAGLASIHLIDTFVGVGESLNLTFSGSGAAKGRYVIQVLRL